MTNPLNLKRIPAKYRTAVIAAVIPWMLFLIIFLIRPNYFEASLWDTVLSSLVLAVTFWELIGILSLIQLDRLKEKPLVQSILEGLVIAVFMLPVTFVLLVQPVYFLLVGESLQEIDDIGRERN